MDIEHDRILIKKMEEAGVFTGTVSQTLADASDVCCCLQHYLEEKEPYAVNEIHTLDEASNILLAHQST